MIKELGWYAAELSCAPLWDTAHKRQETQGQVKGVENGGIYR